VGYKIKVIIPIPMDKHGVQARAAQLPVAFLPDGFEVVKAGAALGDSYHDTLLMDVSVTEAGLKAEQEGFDAICIDTVSDSGMAESLAGKEEVVFNKLLHQAEMAISEDKADVIILGSTTMHQSHAFLAENLPLCQPSCPVGDFA